MDGTWWGDWAEWLRGHAGSVADAPGSLGAEAARKHLETLVDLYERGMLEPPPIACATSAAIAAGGDGRKEWESEWNWDKEDREQEHQLVYGRVLTYEELIEPAPAGDEQAWEMPFPSRFERWAHRLWDGLLKVEERR